MKIKFLERLTVKSTVLMVLAVLLTVVATPVIAAILVQNQSEWEVVVDEPPIRKDQGSDADYDGDGDDSTGYLQVDLGDTFSNSDSTLGTPGSSDTYLSHETVTFTCFAGDRTYYTDVIQLVNTTASEAWDVTLDVEQDMAGNPAVEDTFTDGNGTSDGDADIWLFTSAIDSVGGDVGDPATGELPNPGSYGSLTNWLDGAAPDGAIQLEVVDGVMSVATNGGTTGPVTMSAGEQRQLGLVVDCGSEMVNGETGTFRLSIAATPN